MTQNIKQAIRLLGQLPADETPMIEFIRCWMTITGLDFKDAVHLRYGELVQQLTLVAEKLSDSTDIFDEDQLQEAACRCLKTVKIYGDSIIEEDVSVEQSQTLSWDGSRWNFIVDPKLRMRETSTQFASARDAVLAMFANAAES